MANRVYYEPSTHKAATEMDTRRAVRVPEPAKAATDN